MLGVSPEMTGQSGTRRSLWEQFGKQGQDSAAGKKSAECIISNGKLTEGELIGRNPDKAL
jgi:hypothetical protein